MRRWIRKAAVLADRIEGLIFAGVGFFALGYLVTHPKLLLQVVGSVALAALCFSVFALVYSKAKEHEEERRRREEEEIRRRIDRALDHRDKQWETFTKIGSKPPPRKP